MKAFGKYLQLTRISWENGFVYRLNFIMWRIRNVIQLLSIYFLWNAISVSGQTTLTYSPEQILTYVIGTSFLRAVIFSSRSIDAQGEIATGDLNNYLIKPLNYFYYWLSRDVADKVLNIIFSIGEIFLLYIIIKPSLYLQTDILLIILSFIATAFATILYFLFSFIISMTTFWYYEYNGWAQRFFSIVVIESLAGGLFPLDLLPGIAGNVISMLPTAYFIYFPLQIYLGRIQINELVFGLISMLAWIVIFIGSLKIIWKKGLRIYGAFGR
jgi:ABC-2 type transport system permease protein